MFVGEVRWATTGIGSSWKLSGGSQLSSGPTKVSKNLQVLRATLRANLDSFSVSCLRSGGRGLLSQYATTGEASQITTNGPMYSSPLGRITSVRAKAKSESTMAGSM